MARRIRWVFLLLVLGAVLLVGYTGYQALKARTALNAAASELDQLSTQVTSGEQAAAARTLVEAQRHTHEARSSTSGLGWWISGRLPQIGPNVRAVQTVAQVSDDVATKVLPDVLKAADTLRPDRLRPVHGRIDLRPLEAASPEVSRAASRLSAQRTRIDAVDTTALSDQISGPVKQMQTKIASADRLVDRASRALELLPPMLGSNGRRTYLLMFQNNAESRATGGIPGAFAEMTARNGKVTLRRQDDAQTIGSFRRPPTPLTAQEKALFGTGMGIYPQDVNFTPDFPRSAQLIRGMYEARAATKVDGVVSVDPVALSYLLKGTGPVQTVGGRTIDASTVVPLLLSKVYAEIADPAAQNQYFNAVARTVFDKVTAGAGQPRALVTGLVQATSEQRLLIWSAHPDEERLLAPGAIAGALARTPTSSPEVGVFFNAAGAYKLDYYLDYTASVASSRCVAGRQQLRLDVAMHSAVPKSYRSLPDYVDPVQPTFGRGKILVNTYLFAPIGGRPLRIALDGKSEAFNTRRLDGHRLVARTMLLEPGQTKVLSMTMTSGRGQRDDAHLRVTPGVRGTGIGSIAPSACS